MSDLKPCPFCGSSNTTLDYYEISCPQELGTIVVCNDCGASAKSIVDWNTRPIEDALNKRIAELEAARRWIPVGERLPEEKQNVLALDRTGTAYHWEYSKCLSNIFVGYYTHWMPLPEPPEEVK